MKRLIPGTWTETWTGTRTGTRIGTGKWTWTRTGKWTGTGTWTGTRTGITIADEATLSIDVEKMEAMDYLPSREEIEASKCRILKR
jgi:hypothetical protein